MGFVLPRDGILALLVRIQPIRTALIATYIATGLCCFASLRHRRKRALIGTEFFLSARPTPYPAGPDSSPPAPPLQDRGRYWADESLVLQASLVP